MMKLAMMKPSGAQTAAAPSRYGRTASGTWRRNAPRDSGAPAYMSTEAPVTRPTSECQLGNGSRKTRPPMKARIRLTHGTPRLSVLVRIGGKYGYGRGRS